MSHWNDGTLGQGGVVGKPRVARRDLWKAKLRSATLVDALLLGQWHEKTLIFRWKWQADLAAWRFRLTRRGEVLKDAVVEPYRPGANVVRLQLVHRTAE